MKSTLARIAVGAAVLASGPVGARPQDIGKSTIRGAEQACALDLALLTRLDDSTRRDIESASKRIPLTFGTGSLATQQAGTRKMLRQYLKKTDEATVGVAEAVLMASAACRFANDNQGAYDVKKAKARADVKKAIETMATQESEKDAEAKKDDSRSMNDLVRRLTQLDSQVKHAAVNNRR